MFHWCCEVKGAHSGAIRSVNDFQYSNLYNKVGAHVLRTDQVGTVTVTVQPGGASRISTERGTVPSSQPAAPTPATIPATPPTTSSASYPNCAAVRAAAQSPLLRGQPDYRAGLDRDRDGRACE